MNNPALILIVDDNAASREVLMTRLQRYGYELLQAGDGEEALASAKQNVPDLIILDVAMPKLDGFEVCRRLKTDPTLPFTPIILLTARAATQDVIQGLDAGADEYLTKPSDQAALIARVRSMLRIKTLQDQVQAQAVALADWNRVLERRVEEQIAEVNRLNRLQGFLSPQIAKLVVSPGNEKLLNTHRREITAMFCDLRGFTAFAETAEPEDILALLQEYYCCVGDSIDHFEGTLQHFAGDGVFVMFNDPLPCPDPSVRAARMAVELREQIEAVAQKWWRYGHKIGFGIGIAAGFATLGSVDYRGRFQYSASGTVVNLAARLCAKAADGQILIDGRVQLAIEPIARTEQIGDVQLKGFHRPIRMFNVHELTA
jgi:adenylate cyclase